MASRENSKATKIREYLAAHPDAKAADVVKALKADRVRVTTAHVYNIKATNGKPKRKAKGQAAKRDPFAALILARRLADQVGGVDKAREALDALARLL
jgi:hypothetical protein